MSYYDSQFLDPLTDPLKLVGIILNWWLFGILVMQYCELLSFLHIILINC